MNQFLSLTNIVKGLTAGIASLLAASSCLSVGCAAPAFPREFGQTSQAMAASIISKADWDTVVGRLRGHVNNPGMEVYAGVLYVAGGKMTGADGDVVLEGDGTGHNELTDFQKTYILELFKSDPQLAKEFLEAVREPDVPAIPSAPSN